MLGGAYKDNVVVPYEGITGADLDPGAATRAAGPDRTLPVDAAAGPLRARMSDVERHIAETRFCWSGGIEEESAFYYRIQSPVVMIEFDHHKGVLLTNEEPQRFHTHTIVRTPNGNDYGMDLLRLHYETAPHHKPNQGRQATISTRSRAKGFPAFFKSPEACCLWSFVFLFGKPVPTFPEAL